MKNIKDILLEKLTLNKDSKPNYKLSVDNFKLMTLAYGFYANNFMIYQYIKSVCEQITLDDDEFKFINNRIYKIFSGEVETDKNIHQKLINKFSKKDIDTVIEITNNLVKDNYNNTDKKYMLSALFDGFQKVYDKTY